MEKHDQTSETAQTWARPKVSRTTRQTRPAESKPDSSGEQTSQSWTPSQDQAGEQPQRRGDAYGRRPRRPADEAQDDEANSPSPKSAHHLRTVGPFVSRFSGRVVQVFGTTLRPKPSTAPLQSAVFLFFVAVTLPYAVTLLPALVLLLIVWLLLGRRGWVPGGVRLPRFSRRTASHASLLVTSFRVRVSRDDEDDETEEPREIDCRLVRSAGLGPTPLVGGERVIGRGRRTSQGVIEVSQLGMLDTGAALRTARPKSWRSVLALAGVIVAAGAAVLYIRRNQIPPVDVDAILSILALVLACLLFIYLIKIVFRR